MRALVVGAAGRYGGLVIHELTGRGVEVRGLIRDRPGAEDEARRRGADEVVVADLLDLETLRAAVDGVDRVFHLNPAFAPAEAETPRQEEAAEGSALRSPASLAAPLGRRGRERPITLGRSVTPQSSLCD